MERMSVIKDCNGNIIGIAANKETEEIYKKEGFEIIPVEIINKKVEKKIPINEVKFKILSVCRDGYECTGEKRKREGTIIDLIDNFFYTELSEKQEPNYIPFVDFMKKALENHKEESYIGGCSIELLADMFISELRTYDQELECLSKPKNITKEEIVNYISSLYINEDYEDDYGLDRFCAMR